MTHEALQQDLTQVDEHLLPNAGIDVLKDEHFGQRRIAVVFERQPRILPVGAVVDDTREQDGQLGGKQAEIIDLVQEFFDVAGCAWSRCRSTLSIDRSLNSRFCSRVRCELAWRSGLPQSSQSPAATARMWRTACDVLEHCRPVRCVRQPLGLRHRPRAAVRSSLSFGEIIHADQRRQRPTQARLPCRARL